jgi:hypothetical protein
LIFEDFIGHEDEVKRLSVAMASGLNTAIISPSGWGKSALAAEAFRRFSLRDPAARLVVVDTSPARSEAGFYSLLATRLFRDLIAPGGIQEALDQLLPGIRSEPAGQGHDLRFAFTESDIARGALSDLPLRMSARLNTRLVVILEPAEILMRITDRAGQVRLRDSLQRHRSVSYGLLGGTGLDRFFSSRESPFYRFCDVLSLRRVTRETWVGYLVKQFRESGKSITPDMAGRLCSLVEDHPAHIAALARSAWLCTSSECDEEELDKALADLLRWYEGRYRATVSNLSDTQVNLLRAVVAGVQRFTSVSAMNAFALGTPRNVIKNRELLKASGLLEPVGRGLRLTDPLLSLWLQGVL